MSSDHQVVIVRRAKGWVALWARGWQLGEPVPEVFPGRYWRHREPLRKELRKMELKGRVEEAWCLRGA